MLKLMPHLKSLCVFLSVWKKCGRFWFIRNKRTSSYFNLYVACVLTINLSSRCPCQVSSGRRRSWLSIVSSNGVLYNTVFMIRFLFMILVHSSLDVPMVQVGMRNLSSLTSSRVRYICLRTNTHIKWMNLLPAGLNGTTCIRKNHLFSNI